MKMKSAKSSTKSVIKKPKTTKKKVGKAEEAVDKYEEMHHELMHMRDEFQVKYPQAHNELQQILKFEDEVREQIDTCKVLVREAKQSIGPFTCTLKFSSEGYDGGLLLKLFSSLPTQEAGELLQELFQRGLVVDVKVDKAAAKVVRSSDPELRERLEPAWDKGGVEMTPAIGTPKL